MQQPREFHQFGTKSVDIQSIITISKLSHESYRVTMSNMEVIEIDGEDRCKQLLEVVGSRLGIAFQE